MAEEQRPVRRRRKRRRNPIISIISALLICGALLLGVSVFFKISVIRVEGTARYSPEQVIEASGIEIGDNLFFVNKFDAISKIFKLLPYIDEATISRDLPNILIISVKDAEAVAYVRTGEDIWLVDKSCKLLEKAGAGSIAGIIEVTGLSPIMPVAGERISAGEAEKAKVTYLESLLNALYEADMLSYVTAIDITNVSELSFDYMGRFKVKMGKSGDIEGKIGLLLEAVGYLSPVAEGTIDLTQDKEARFITD